MITNDGLQQGNICDGLNAIFDRIALQQNAGYWCYDVGGCPDSSTTQFIDAGLAALRFVYSDPAGCLDPGRLATLNALLASTRAAYVANGTAGGAGGVLTADERGHGYNVGHPNSIQQTSSGAWAQLVGGANVNDPSVQAYLRWLRNRYAYVSITQEVLYYWPSFFYYQWALSKTLRFIEDAGVPALGANLDGDDLGTLPPGSAPAFAPRQLHRDPNTDPRVPLFGPGGPGYYMDPNEPARVYYDQAYTLISLQDGAGQYQDDPASGGNWENCSRQAYTLLVLQRSVGGGIPPTCGDNTVEGGEQCDGTDDLACPGMCAPDCTCPGATPTPGLPTPIFTGPTPTPGPTADLNHFQCYEAHARNRVISGVSLTDQFGPSTVQLIEPRRFCAPANKFGEDPTAVTDPDHLEGYRLRQTTPKFQRLRGYTMENQFGDARRYRSARVSDDPVVEELDGSRTAASRTRSPIISSAIGCAVANRCATSP